MATPLFSSVYSLEAAIAPVAFFRQDFSANSTENSASKVRAEKEEN
jgi:hypothetical protein